MRLPLLTVLGLLCGTLLRGQPPVDQLTIDDTYDAERLVQEVFSSSQCETITNIRQIGTRPDGIGFFEAPNSILGFNRGIIISTGRVGDAAGPNQSTSTGVEQAGPTLDEDLDIASGSTIFDRSGIEFDFVPLQREVTFRYVFASEEYCDFVGNKFNDIFGFFISGPGITGSQNVALVPGTDDVVSINSVNFTENASFYLDNEDPDQRAESNCGGNGDPGPLYEDIEYDGLTTILTATLDLEPCLTYKLRLVVGDVSDGEYDSAVFFEAGSFDLGGNISLERDSTDGEVAARVVYEGCEPTKIRVQRGADGNLTRPETIDYHVSSASVAQMGTDFTAGSGQVTIPAGATFAEIEINATEDGLAEGSEAAWIVLDIPCACYTDSIELSIQDPPPLKVELDEAFYCPGQDAVLKPRVTGGVAPLEYLWNFGNQGISTDPAPVLTPPLPNALSVTVSDACRQSDTAFINTFSSAPPTVSSPVDRISDCVGSDQSIPLNLEGSGPITLNFRISNGPDTSVTFPGAGSRQWSVDRSGVYRILSVEDAACRMVVNDRIRVDFFQPLINPRITPPTCVGVEDGGFTVTHLQTTGPYNYRWSGVLPDSLSAANLPAGTYGLTVTDGLGCSDERDIILPAPDALLPVDISCNQVRRPPLVPSARGGVPPYRYSIDGQNFFGKKGWTNLSPGSFYNLTIRDARDCQTVQEDFFFPRASPLSATLPTFVPQELAGASTVNPIYRVPPDQIIAYRWSPAEFFDCANCPNPTVSVPASMPISLAIDDRYGCTDSIVTQVAVDGRVPVFVPTAFSPDGNGRNDVLAVFANPEQVDGIVVFQVYNRWGELLWEDAGFAPNDPRRGWNGLVNGQKASSGAYVWRAEVLLNTGEVQSEAGTSVLLR